MARLVAMTVAALLLLSGCGDGSSSAPESASAPSTVDRAFRCPGPHVPARGDGGSDTLPTGATAAVLCLRDNNTPWTPPRGFLTTGLDDLVDVVNGQQVHHPAPDEGCGGVGAPAWSMVFRYPDGTRTITGDNGGCWDLLVGSSERFGSRNVFQAYLTAVLRQRDQGSPGVLRKTPSCPRAAPGDPNPPYVAASPAAQAQRVVTGTWCRRAGRRWVYAGTATDRQLAALRHDLATAASRRHGFQLDHCRGLPRTTHTLLVGRDAWGDLLGLDFTCASYQTVTAPFPHAYFVRMLPRTVAVVAHAR